MKRRAFIQQSSILTAAAALPHASLFSSPMKSSKMGLAITSYGIRWKSAAESAEYPGFQNALDLLNHCHSIGTGGIQTGIKGWTTDFAGKVRDQREKLGMYLEGQLQLPKASHDVDQFEKDIKAAKEAGVEVVRTACLSGRRYENFSSMEAFQAFKTASIQSVEWAEPIMRKHKVRLAVENHKDWRYEELVELMKRFDSEWIGVTLDTGNNLAFLEENPMVIEALAPYAFSTHIKDMAYKKYDDGILLSEVPLGEGMVDLGKAISLCKKYNPRITFNLEMITRDPLRIPCLTDGYWETFDHAFSGRDLARVWRTAREADYQLPTVSDRNEQERLAFEEENNLKSLNYAVNSLGL